LDIQDLAETAKNMRPTIDDKVLYSLSKDAVNHPNLENKRKQINPEIGFKFDGHGIDNDTSHGDNQYTADLRGLIYLLQFGSDPDLPGLHSMNLVPRDGAAAMGAAHPYTDGGFVVLGEYDKPLTDKIAAVLVNPHFYHAIEKLEEAFPDIKFIKAEDLPDALYELVPEDDLEKQGIGLDEETSDTI
jgi:hypothetical protein